jgi:hypothetical protein
MKGRQTHSRVLSVGKATVHGQRTMTRFNIPSVQDGYMKILHYMQKKALALESKFWGRRITEAKIKSAVQMSCVSKLISSF